MFKLYILVAAGTVLLSVDALALEMTSGSVAQCGCLVACDQPVGCDAAPSACCHAPVQGCDARPSHYPCNQCCKKKPVGLFGQLMELERRKNQWILENIFNMGR